MCDQQSLRSACAYAQSGQSLCKSLENSVSVKLLTEHHMKFLSLKGGCTGSSGCTVIKMPHCWKSHVTAHLIHFRLFETNDEVRGMFAKVIKNLNNVVCATSKASDQPAHTRCLIRVFASRLSIL